MGLGRKVDFTNSLCYHQNRWINVIGNGHYEPCDGYQEININKNYNYKKGL